MVKKKTRSTRLKTLGLIALSSIATGFLTLSFKNNNIALPSYQATRVIDGDTFETKEKQWIRISGIDAPETGLCGSKEAKQALEKLILGKDLYLKVMYHDSTRLMSQVYSKDGLVATQMLQTGWVELNDRDNLGLAEFTQARNEAQSKKLGLFSSLCTQQSNPDKASCVIKGNNTNNNEPTYHLPGCNSYERTAVQLHHGDQWFCTEAEAIKAGYTKAKTCP